MKRIIVFCSDCTDGASFLLCWETRILWQWGRKHYRTNMWYNLDWRKKEYEDGSSWESIWNFDKDGTYTRANVEIDKDGNKKKVRFVEDGLSPLLTLAHYILVVVIIGILKNWIRQSFHSTIEQENWTIQLRLKNMLNFTHTMMGKLIIQRI